MLLRCLLAGTLLAIAAPVAAQMEKDWRIFIVSADAMIMFDAKTIAVDGAMRTFESEAILPKIDENGSIGYATTMRIDCARHLSQTVTLTTIRPDSTRRPAPIDRPGLQRFEHETFVRLLHDRMCLIKDRKKYDGGGVYLQTTAFAAAKATFALLKLDLDSEQAGQLASRPYYTEEELVSAFDEFKIPASKRAAVRLALAAQTAEIPKPPPPIVPLASAVATGRVGQYVHSEMELASGIWLKADGTFEYFLTVGSLDESARGRWSVEGDRLRMVNDPKVVAPTITAGPARVDPKVALSIKVVTPAGRGMQGVDIAVEFDGGQAEEAYTQTDGWSLPLGDKRRRRFVTLSMSSYGLRSPRFPIDGAANALTFVLTPNDFGVVDFTGIGVTVDKGDLVVRRQGSEMRYERRADRRGKPD